MRKWILRIHLVLGILLGIYVTLIGVTGSVLVYREEFAARARPDLFVPVDAIRSSPDEAAASIAKAFPGWKMLSLEGPDALNGTWTSYLIGKGPAKVVFVDASTGAMRGHYEPGEWWVGKMDSLHGNLMSGRNGRVVNGYCAIGCVLLTATGLLLWRPPLSRLRWRALNVHVNLGLVAALFLFLTGITGAYFTWHQPYVDVAHWLLPSRKVEPLPPVVVSGDRKSLAEMLETAKRVAPGTRLLRVPQSRKPTEPVDFTMRHGRDFEFQLVSHVVINPYTGEIMRLDQLEDRLAGDRLVGQYSSVHNGVWGGELSRALWCVLGLTLPVLFGTSFVLWWRKLRQRGLVGLWG
ncbi:MAG: PepSY-associated TM helix domain-containing protein [Chloroflexia bacterium]